MDVELQESAQQWAEYMARKNRLKHDDLHHSRFGYLGENIACGQGSVKEVMEDWMQSKGHRENILNSDYTHIGVGIVQNGEVFWCVKFGGQPLPSKH